jgi:hypothetical protein
MAYYDALIAQWALLPATTVPAVQVTAAQAAFAAPPAAPTLTGNPQVDAPVEAAYVAAQATWHQAYAGIFSSAAVVTRIALINAENVTGAVPTLVTATGAQIFNCLVYSEFTSLTQAQQTMLMQVLAIPGNLQGGSASTFLAPMFGALFAGKPLTLANLVALSKGLSQPWWQSAGYRSSIAPSDLEAVFVQSNGQTVLV